jgi:hypothetical protein
MDAIAWFAMVVTFVIYVAGRNVGAGRGMEGGDVAHRR